MVRKTLMAVSLALLAVGAAQPAKAAPVFLEPYGDIFGARTVLGRANDERPKDAIQGQEEGEEGGRTSAFFLNPFYRNQGNEPDFAFGRFRTTYAGSSIGYAGALGSNNPFQVWGNLYAFNVHGPIDTELGFDIGGKFVVWQPSNRNLPVVSLVGQYRDVDFFNRIDALVAIDQRITDTLYLTGNVGYARLDNGIDEDDIVAGVGATWRAAPRLSFSANYVIDNDVDGEDFWSLAGIYALNQDIALRLGGGKHETFFGNVIWKFGPRGGGGGESQK